MQAWLRGPPPPSSAQILLHQASSQVYVLALTGFPGKNGQLFRILLLAASSRLFFRQDFSQVPEEGEFIYEANPFLSPGLFWAVQGETHRLFQTFRLLSPNIKQKPPFLTFY